MIIIIIIKRRFDPVEQPTVYFSESSAPRLCPCATHRARWRAEWWRSVWGGLHRQSDSLSSCRPLYDRRYFLFFFYSFLPPPPFSIWQSLTLIRALPLLRREKPIKLYTVCFNGALDPFYWEVRWGRKEAKKKSEFGWFKESLWERRKLFRLQSFIYLWDSRVIYGSLWLHNVE